MEGSFRCYGNMVIEVRKAIAFGEDELAILDDAYGVSRRAGRTRKESIDRRFLNRVKPRIRTFLFPGGCDDLRGNRDDARVGDNHQRNHKSEKSAESPHVFFACFTQYVFPVG